MNHRCRTHGADRLGEIRPDIIPDRSSSEKTEADIVARWDGDHVLHRSEPRLESFVATCCRYRLNPEQSQVNGNGERIVPPNFFSDGGIQFSGSNRILAVNLNVVNAWKSISGRRCHTAGEGGHK